MGFVVRRRVVAAAWLTLAALAPLASPAPAAPPSASAASTVTAPIDFGALAEEVAVYREASTVYAASRRVEKTSEAPASVTVVTRDEIRRYGWRTLAEVLRAVRGLYTTDDRTYAYLGVRGMQRPGDYNTRVLLTVDGHRINDTVYDQAMVGGEFPLDVDLIERVEVVRGPGSSLYGTSAMFGVVNVVTRRGRDLRGGEVAVSVGSFGTLERRVTYGQKDGRTEALVSLSGLDSDGRDFFFPEFPAQGLGDGFSLGSDGERWRHWLATGSAGRFSLQAFGSDRDKALPGAPFGTDLGSPGTRYQDRWTTVVARYDRAGESRTDVAASLAYHWYDFTGPYVYGGESSQDEVRAAWWDLETQLTRQVHGRHRATFGAEYRRNDHQDQAYVTFPTPSVDDFDVRVQEVAWALYAQDEWRLRRNLAVTAGIRRDQYENVGGSTTPRLALVHAPREGTTWKLMYGEAFRAPNVYERLYPNGGNPDLVPERVRSLEASFERRLAPGTTLTLGAFDQHITDLIAFDDDAGGFLNVDSADSRGVELELARRRKDGHEQVLSWSFQHPTDGVTGEALPNAPRQVGKLRVGVPLAGPRTAAGMELLYVGSRLGQSRGVGLPPAEAGGYALFNLNLSHRPHGERFEVGLGVYNLFDRAFADPTPVFDFVPDSMPGEGRAVRVKVTWRF